MATHDIVIVTSITLYDYLLQITERTLTSDCRARQSAEQKTSMFLDEPFDTQPFLFLTDCCASC